MRVEFLVSFNEYYKLILKLSYKRIAVIILTLMGIINFIFCIITLNDILNNKNDSTFFSVFISFLLSLLLIFFNPIFIYIKLKYSFKSNKMFKEKMCYEITNDTIKMIGSYFNSELKLESFYSFVEYNDWFLLFQDKLVFNFIYKKSLTNDEILKIREILKSQKNVILKLQ
jgi:hypothetical protein